MSYVNHYGAVCVVPCRVVLSEVVGGMPPGTIAALRSTAGRAGVARSAGPPHSHAGGMHVGVAGGAEEPLSAAAVGPGVAAQRRETPPWPSS